MTIAATIISGLSLILCGVLAYTGKWKRWAYSSGYTLYGGFSLLFFGIALFLTAVLKLLFDAYVSSDVLIFIWSIFAVVAVLGFWWMPAFMLPQWFRDGREDRRKTERAIAEARKAIRAEKKANKR